MAKKKKYKKVKRDIEKLLRTGRYWEWLRKVEDEKLASEFPQELEQVWKTLTRKALRLPQEFEQFTQNVEQIKALPRLPDLQFLVNLKAFIEGSETGDQLLQAKGLSPAAEALKERLILWEDKICSADQLEKTLSIFMKQPEKVTKRHFDQLAKLLNGNEMVGWISKLSGLLADFRRLNHKSSIKKGWSAIGFREIKKMDMELARVSRALPASLRNILLLPMRCQAASLLQRLAMSGNNSAMAELVGSMGFLFSMVAGEKADEISKQVILAGGDSLHKMNLAKVGEQMENATLEENILLLKRLRSQLREEKYLEDDLMDLLPFMSSEPESGLQSVFHMLYDKVLKEIADQAEGLGPREKKELRRVMDPFLVQDLPLLAADPEDAKELAPLLARFLAAGCAGKRTALLALVVSRRSRSSSLQTAANEVLAESLAIDTGDIDWLLKYFDNLYFPHLQALVPLLDRFQNDAVLLGKIICGIHARIEEFMAVSTISKSKKGMLRRALDFLSHEMREEYYILQQNLVEMRSYPALDEIYRYLSFFPKGYFTREGFLRWFEYLYNEDNWQDYLRDKLEQIYMLKHRSMPISFVDMDIPVSFIEDQVMAIFEFLKRHIEDFRTIEVHSIQRFMKLLNPMENVLRDNTDFLVRLNNILAERHEAGEVEVAPLKNDVLKLLRALAEPKKSGGKSRRRRR